MGHFQEVIISIPDQENDAVLSGDSQGEAREIRVWDLPTRVFHWSLAVSFAIAWISSEADGALFQIHVASGIGIMGLIIFRLIWGLVGSRHARFVDFVRGWNRVREYARGLIAFKPGHSVGHNPIGGWMILALLGGLALTSINGLFLTDDGYSGPLAGLVSPWLSRAMGEIHEGIAGFFGFLVIIHIAGVIVHGIMARENLARAMWTGVKILPAGAHGASITGVGWWRAVLAIALSAAVVWSLF